MLEQYVNYKKGSFSDLIVSNIKNPLKRYDIIYIDIWFDGNTLKSSFNGHPDCLHNKSIEDNLCPCGAWVGNLLEEVKIEDYYKHIFNLVNGLRASEIYIRSPKFYPPEYMFELFGTEVKLGFPFVETYHIYDKLSSVSNKFISVNQKDFYITHFTKKKSKLWKSKVLTYKGFNPLYLMGSNSLWVNPYYKEVKTDIDIDYFICNTEVLKTLTK